MKPNGTPTTASAGTGNGAARGNETSALRGRVRQALRPFRQAKRSSKVLIYIGLSIVAFFLLLTIFGPLLYPYDGVQYRGADGSPFPSLQAPSGEHIFGTTRDGFDVLARVIDGTKLAFIVMLIAVSMALVLGVVIGLASGYRGGRIDRALVTVMDAVYAFPPLVLAIIVSFVLAAYLPAGVLSAAGAVGILYIPQYFRVVRNHTLSVKQEPFVEAARSLGAKSKTILGRYVFFNVISSVPVILTLNAADAILVLAALGFLGYGVEPPTAEWGYDISQAITDVSAGVWWTAFWPGLAIVLLVTALTLVGEGLNDVVNPLLRSRGVAGPKIETAGAAAASTDVAKDADDNAAVAVRNLRVGYRTPDGPLWAVDDVDFRIEPGESLGLVGESGCGKSSLGRALMQLLPAGGAVTGNVTVAGEELVGAAAGRLRRRRGEDLGLVFQEPMTRLNPLMKVSDHFVEMIKAHRSEVSGKQARTMAIDALAKMGIPPTRIDNYPHQLSGGMRQRAMIALSIVLEPKMIIADEPTTSLDVIVESQILDVLDKMRAEQGVGLLLITHNLGIVAETCDKVAVMYAGKIVETGTVDQIFSNPKHPYTQGLLASTISLETSELHSIAGYPPDLLNPPTGCRFAARCEYAMPHCTEGEPRLAEVAPGQAAACYLYPGAEAEIPDEQSATTSTGQVSGV